MATPLSLIMKVLDHVNQEVAKRIISEGNLWTQDKLAKKLGWSQPYVSYLLNGKKPLTDQRALRFLTRGFDYSFEAAKLLLVAWRIEEYQETLK